MATPSSPPPQPDPDQHLPDLPFSTTTTTMIVPPPTQTSATKKSPPLPWTHQETINLIQAYQDKWYSLKRGQLKAFQWEEVAVTVAARCGYDLPSKTATQCRHKIEKLRKRYRAEKQKPYPHAWQYFEYMDCMERGPLPISARPMAPKTIQFHNHHSNSSHIDEEDEDDDEDEDNNDHELKSRSINHIVRGRVSQNLGFGNRKECFSESVEEEDDDDEDEVEEEKVVAGLAAEIKAFAERFVRMEKRKMEMMRETERCRLEMENKRMEMIRDSQRKIVDTIGRAFGSHKKLKVAQEL